MTEQIAIANIIIPEDRRPLNLAKVAEIAESIKAVGLLSPIGVRPESSIDGSWRCILLYGRHRLEACRSLGWEKIEAIGVTDICPGGVDIDETAVELIEIAENLHRADLTTQERNEHIARWAALLEKRKPPDIGAAAPISKKPGRKPSAAVAEVAKRSGLGIKAVREAIKTANLAPDVKAAADDAKLSHKQRLAIARLPEVDQLREVRKHKLLNSRVALAKVIRKKADRRDGAAAIEPAPKQATTLEPEAHKENDIGPRARSLIKDVRQLISKQLPGIPETEWSGLVKELNNSIDILVGAHRRSEVPGSAGSQLTPIHC